MSPGLLRGFLPVKRCISITTVAECFLMGGNVVSFLFVSVSTQFIKDDLPDGSV